MFLSCKKDICYLHILPWSSQSSHVVLGTAQTNRWRGKQVARAGTFPGQSAKLQTEDTLGHPHITGAGEGPESRKRNVVKTTTLPKLKPPLWHAIEDSLETESWTKMPSQWLRAPLRSEIKATWMRFWFNFVLCIKQKTAWTHIAERKRLIFQAFLKDDGLSNISRSLKALAASGTGCKKPNLLLFSP